MVQLPATHDIDIETGYYSCSDFPFNFHFCNYLDHIDAALAQSVIDTWIQSVPHGRPANWLVRSKCLLSHWHYFVISLILFYLFG